MHVLTQKQASHGGRNGKSGRLESAPNADACTSAVVCRSLMHLFRLYALCVSAAAVARPDVTGWIERRRWWRAQKQATLLPRTCGETRARGLSVVLLSVTWKRTAAAMKAMLVKARGSPPPFGGRRTWSLFPPQGYQLR